MNDAWEAAYEARPESFRYYPNEEFIRFLSTAVLRGTTGEDRAAIRMLEVGCGNAANLWAPAAEGIQAHGVDLSPTGLQLARATLQRRAVVALLARGDALHLPYRAASFAAAYDVVSLQHLAFAQLAPAYQEIHRVLEPGGKFFTCHMGARTWDHDHGGGRLVGHHTFEDMGDAALFPHLGTICLPEAEDLVGELAAAGFTRIEVEDLVRSYDGRTRHVRFLVVTAERGWKS